MASDEEDDDDNADKKEDDDMEGEVILKWYILIFESKSNLYNPWPYIENIMLP